MQQQGVKRIVRWEEVVRLTGLSRSWLKTLVSEGKFPRPFALVDGGRAVGFFIDELGAWQEQRGQARFNVEAEKARRSCNNLPVQPSRKRKEACFAGRTGLPTGLPLSHSLDDTLEDAWDDVAMAAAFEPDPARQILLYHIAEQINKHIWKLRGVREADVM